MNTFAVVTTINPPTDAVRRLEALFPDKLIVVGDRKTPSEWECGKAKFLSVETQAQLPLALNEHSPHDHYSRKNIGYLNAMLRGAEAIYDTDDDNTPNDHWVERSKVCEVELAKGVGWCNAYEYFSDARIWPRGLPLDAIDAGLPKRSEIIVRIACPIQQGLADGAPDVDAIWRIAMGSPPIAFHIKRSVALAADLWCPFNSQTTWWFPEAFPLMFLPTLAPFRMTDIWRSFVAQRCLWASGLGPLAFHSPSEVFQDRNPHDLFRDFKDEVPGYLHNREIVKALRAQELGTGIDAMPDNMRACYAAIVALGVLPQAELAVLDAWLADVRRMTKRVEWTKA